MTAFFTVPTPDEPNTGRRPIPRWAARSGHPVIRSRGGVRRAHSQSSPELWTRPDEPAPPQPTDAPTAEPTVGLDDSASATSRSLGDGAEPGAITSTDRHAPLAPVWPTHEAHLCAVDRDSSLVDQCPTEPTSLAGSGVRP
jgi:hypothetical protein